MRVLDVIFRSGCRTISHQFNSTSTSLLSATASAAFNPQIQQVRWGKRKGVKDAKLAKMRKLGLLPEKPVKKLKPSVQETAADMKSKKRTPLHLQYPARIIQEERPAVPTQLTDNVLLSFKYRDPIVTVSEALSYHREQMSPVIFNNPTAPVRLRLDINMTTEKKRRFIQPRKFIVQMPHMFAVSHKRFVLAFTDDITTHALAKDAGAEIVGGVDLIKKVIKGTFRTDDFDYIVAHENVLNSLVSIRALVRGKFPSPVNGCLGTDIVALVRHVMTGVEINVEQDDTHPAYGVIDVVVGTLDMPDEHLEANIQTVFKEINNIRPSTKKLGHFVDRAMVMLRAHGPDEYFVIDHLKYLPLSTEKGAKISDEDVYEEAEPETEEQVSK